MLALFGTKQMAIAPPAPSQPMWTSGSSQDEVLVLLRDIAIGQSNMAHRITRIESRLVGLLLANGLDRNGKQRGDGR